jgi:crotonobetainyl-CoA:carnitine CoA-transferase CaiB-like acyl-CoA transferase
VPCGPIYKVDEMFADPQVQHLGIAQTLNGGNRGDVAYVGQPIGLSRTPSSIASHPPALGEHTDEILAEYGLDKAAIADLRARQVI